jgi:hypothetical protein
MNKLGKWISIIKRWPAPFILTGIMLFYLLNGIFYLRAQSPTSDEGSFLYYAARLVKGHPEKIYPGDDSKLPVFVINLIPRAVNQLLHPGLKKTDNGQSDVFAGRYVTLFISAFIILLVFHWSKKLYGKWAALFSALLVSLCPNLLASAGLVTSDCYSAFMLLVTVYFLWKFINTRAKEDFIRFSFCVALSQLVKQSLFLLYLLFPMMLTAYYLVFRPTINWRIAALYIFYFILINWFVINLGFYFRESNNLLGSYRFVSKTFQQLQKSLPSTLPIPFPRAFITGLDMSKHADEFGGGDYVHSNFGKVTILGKFSNGGSFWYYYLITLLFKTPISNIIFILGGMLTVFRNRSRRFFFQNEFFLLAPVLFYLIYMSIFYKTQIGVRQIIFIFPLLFILCGSLILYLRAYYMRVTLAILTVVLLISVMGYWRNYYPYTNEFITDKKMAYRYVGCSNLDFKQSKYFNEEYLRKHPEVRPCPTEPSTGTFLINLSDYMDIWNLHQYDWISQIPPCGEVACNGLLVTVHSCDLKNSLIHVPEQKR